MKKLLFSIASYDYMAPRFLAAGDFEEGAIERKTFPDGERYLRLATDPWARDVVLLGGTPTDADWRKKGLCYTMYWTTIDVTIGSSPTFVSALWEFGCSFGFPLCQLILTPIGAGGVST